MSSVLKSYKGNLALVSDASAIEGYIKDVKIFNLNNAGISLLDSNGNSVINLTLDSSMNIATLNSNQTIDGSKTFSKDILISDENQGVILTDRSDTSKKYRLYVNNGNFGIEEV